MYKGVYLTGVSALQGCLPYRGVCLTGVSALQGCLPYMGVHLTGVSALQGCLPYRGVCLTGVSAIQGCLPYRGVCFDRVDCISDGFKDLLIATFQTQRNYWHCLTGGNGNIIKLTLFSPILVSWHQQMNKHTMIWHLVRISVQRTLPCVVTAAHLCAMRGHVPHRRCAARKRL